MAGRPEGSDGHRYEVHTWDQNAADDDWEPWRPGDPSPAALEAPSYASSGHDIDGRRWTPDEDSPQLGASSGAEAAAAKSADEPRKPWWTEPATRRYESGDKVRATGSVGGGAFSTVHAGTKGEVVGRHHGLLGGEYVDVKFSNGYTETVTPDSLERRSWYD